MTDTRDANRLLRPFPFHSNSLAMAFDCFAHFDTLSFDCFALRNHATQCNAQAPTLRTTSLPIRSVIASLHPIFWAQCEYDRETICYLSRYDLHSLTVLSIVFFNLFASMVPKD